MKRWILPLSAVAAVLAAAASCQSPAGRGADGDLSSVYGAYLSARYAGGLQDADAAAERYRAALALEPDNPELLERAFMASLAAGQMDDAARLAEPALKIEPADRLARIVLASRAVRAKRYDRAKGLLEDHDLGPFNRVIGALVLAWAHAGEGDTEAALAALDAPDDAPILGHLMTLHRALILDGAGRTEEAEKFYKEAYSTGLLRPLVVDAYGRSMEIGGRGEEARELYAAQFQNNPDDPIADAALARVARGEKAAPFVRTAAQGASAGVFGPASTLARNSQSELAIVYLRLALDLDPRNGAARQLLGDILASVDLHAPAHGVYDGSRPGDAFYESSKIDAAFMLLQMNETEAGIDYLKGLNDVDPSYRTRMALADAYRSAERYAEAEPIYDRLIQEIDGDPRPEDWRTFYSRAVARERTERWPEAEGDFLTALELFPDQPLVLNYLGYTWIDRGEHLDRGFDMIRRAVALQPNSGFIIDSLGWAHYRLGEYDEAVRRLERAVELEPADPEINEHLGDAYWRVGRRLEATYQWERALASDPQAANEIALKEKLERGMAEEPAARLASP